MGLEILPDELLLTLKEQWPCRESQLRQLTAVLSVSSLLKDRNDFLPTDRDSLVFPALLPLSHTAPTRQERAASFDHTWNPSTNDM